jgi:TonB family protein
MARDCLRTAGLALAAVTALAPRAWAIDWQRVLGLPVSPGSVALLVEHAAEPAVRARWAEALKDPRPAVRAAAARSINVAAVARLVPEVAAALGTETDASAAAEEAEVLAALGGPARDEDLLAVAQRTPRFVRPIALALARSRGRQALGSKPLLSALATESSWSEFVLLATRRDSGALTYAGSVAVRERNGALLSAVLAAARHEDVALDDGVLVSSLLLPAPEMRALTYWHLVLAAAAPSPRVVEAVDAAPEGRGDSPEAAAGLAYEMLRRRLGRPAREDPSLVGALRDPSAPWELASDRAALERLTATELSALSERAPGEPGELAKWLRSKDPHPLEVRKDAKPGAAGAEAAAGLRMLDGLPAGLVSDLLRVSACAGGRKDAFHGGQVTYGPDGRPREVTLLAAPDVSPQCVQAVRAMLFLALAPTERVGDGGHPDTLIVPLASDALACLGEDVPAAAPRAASEPVRRGRIKEPKKIRHVDPWYPEGARRLRIEGTVVLEAVISPSGCISALKVLRSRHPALDLVSLITVARWRYTPTLLDGVAVPVIMTITVNFRLS